MCSVLHFTSIFMINWISFIVNDSKQKEYIFFNVFVSVSSSLLAFFWTMNPEAKSLPYDTHQHAIQEQREEVGMQSPPTLFPLVGRAMKRVQTGICTNGFIQNLQLFTWCSISTDTFLLVDDFSFCYLSSQLHCTIFSALKWGKETVYQVFWWLSKLIFSFGAYKVFILIFIYLFNSIFLQGSDCR